MLICLIIICEKNQIVNIVPLIVKIQLTVSMNVQNVCSLSYLLIVKTLLCLILYTDIWSNLYCFIINSALYGICHCYNCYSSVMSIHVHKEMVHVPQHSVQC